MNEQPTLLQSLGQRLARWLARAYPAGPAPVDRPASEAQRKSIHDVTLEQLGIAHWTSHTLL